MTNELQLFLSRLIESINVMHTHELPVKGLINFMSPGHLWKLCMEYWDVCRGYLSISYETVPKNNPVDSSLKVAHQ